MHENDQKKLQVVAEKLNYQVGNYRNPAKLLTLLNNDKLCNGKDEFTKLDASDDFLLMLLRVELNPNQVKDIPGDDKSFKEAIFSTTEELNQLNSDNKQMKKQIEKINVRYKDMAEKQVHFLQLLLSFIYLVFVTIF